MVFNRRVAVIALSAALVGVPVRAEDPVAALARHIEAGSSHLTFDTKYGYVASLLEALQVPVESQVAVFSKTSIQGMIIQPSNPRVLYFNDSVAVGWMHGGFIELAAQAPTGAIRFYVLMQRPDERITPRLDCVKCHTSSALLMRSVTPSRTGVSSSEQDVDGRTPYSQLWGGWFVTGEHVPPGHKGNSVVENSTRQAIEPALDPTLALTQESDAVALMVFTHQMRMMNLLANPQNVNELVDYLLFADAAPIPGKVTGKSGFAEKFAAKGPKDRRGRSLREFDLDHRFMRYPCSYMVYSDAFDGLSTPVKQAVYRRIWKILSGNGGPLYRRLPRTDRKAVVEILRDTKSDLPNYFLGAIR